MGEPIAVTPAVERVWVHLARAGQALAVVGLDSGKLSSCMEWVKRLGRFSLLLHADNLTSQQVICLLKTSATIIF